MKFSEIKSKIVNNPGFKNLAEIRQAGYRIVKERDGERYFLVRQDELKPLLVRLGDIAEVRFGIKTGANEFFYLQPLEMSVAEVAKLSEENPSAPVLVKNGAGWEGKIEAEFLKPVVTSLREVKTIEVGSQHIAFLLFVCPSSKQALAQNGKNHALRYIEWGEKQGYNNRRTCASRPRWWDLGNHAIPSVIYSRRLGDRHLCPANKSALVSDTLYEVHTSEGEIVALLLSSTLYRLMLETEGRELTGSITVVELYIPDVLKTFVLNPAVLDHSQRNSLRRILVLLRNRDMKSLFQELGFVLCEEQGCLHPEHPYEFITPSQFTLDKVLPDRRELDAVIFEVLGLTEDEQLAVYRAVVELVKNRLVKARSMQ